MSSNPSPIARMVAPSRAEEASPAAPADVTREPLFVALASAVPQKCGRLWDGPARLLQALANPRGSPTAATDRKAAPSVLSGRKQ